ncbi:hypothetical protein KPL71_017493 [Citrus sinensis]|uniref:Uncharacterized protein n=1 Tax=Citrus sinensis TaxID=2711 RepID=A0ACB8JQF3_CITSI|nr:hypothetical protein KPL71_017493 [Citrus sinensis]
MATKTEDPSTSTATPIVEDSSSDAKNKASPTEPEPLMPPPIPDHSTKPSSASWFTFDDIPCHKWPARHQEFTAWIDLQGTKPNAQPQALLREFMARSTGSLRDWLETLGEYRQLQFMQSPIGTALNIIHEQFIGEKTASTDADRKEYHQMKCCSLKRHLLESHYKRMSILFYKLNGFNESSLKHVFIASLPSKLQPDLQRKLTATNLSIADISLGKIFQMAMLYVESNFSEQLEQDDQTAFIIAESSDSDDISVISTVQIVNHVSTIPRPSLKMSILPLKFHKPVLIIGFIDTGADTSMIDHSVLPSDCWGKHLKLFQAETFETTLITKKPIVKNLFQMPSPKSQPSPSKPGYRRDCPYPPCRGPNCISVGNPSLRTTGPKYSLNYCSSGITTPRTLYDFRRRENFSFMASTSSSTSSNPVTLSSTLSLPKSCTSHTANKIENLVEYSYIPESAQISESSYSLISPYHLYKRPSSFTRNIRTLISTRRPHPKEYIQSSRLDQCSLQATPAEQYVTLEIPSELISNWKREGYTHLHLGGIRLILTLHGRKGLPVTARLAMLDTRFKQYQDAVIGTVLTTLHVGSVLLTFYPNFNLSLQDLNLPTTLKVQVQIQGAEQISSAKIATLHHQLVYRLQNHALDLPTPEHHSDTLMVLAESDQISTIIQIPRQIPRHELIKLMPLEWISNYEQFHNNTAPIQTSKSMFERRQDGTVRMTFKPPPSAPQEPPRLSFTYSSMIRPLRKICPLQGLILKVTLFIQPNTTAISYGMPLVQACVTQIVPAGMIGKTTMIMQPQEKRNPKRKNLLSHIETKVDSITTQMQQIHQNLHSRIGQLDSELRAMLAHRYNGPEFDQKEREIRRLKAELAQIEYEKQRPTLFTTSPPIPSIGLTYHPFASMLSPIKQYDPSKLFGMTHTLFKDNPLPPPPKPKPKPRPQPRPGPLHPSSLTIPGQPSPSSTPTSPLAPLSIPTQSKDKEPMHQFTAHTVTHSFTTADQTSDSNLAVSDGPTQTDTESSVSTSDSEKSYADITKILMAQPDQPTQGQTSHTELYVDIPSEVEEEMHESSATNHPPPAQTNPSSQKSSNGLWFTFDDLPSHKWQVSSALAVLHDQFLGDPSAVFEAARRDYLNMKCCSLNAKDLDFHYKRISNATRKRIAIVVQRKNGIFGNSNLQNFHPNLADPESPTGSSERNLPPPENSNESNQADVSSAREKATMPKIVPTKEKNPSVPIPSIKLQILPSKFQRPIPAIGLIDTGAQRSMLNPHILSSEYWTQSEEHFKAVNGKLFTTSLITKKPIGSHAEHRQLLTQFYDILQSHGIMLSAKKSTIATNNIEFLGMVIKDGHYQPGKHIAQELLHFPDQQLSKRQIQQFLGIINYIRDFIPHVDHYTHHLSALLKKKPPEWNADHTIAVTTLKQIAQNPPPLKLITDGQRILQTNASDESWGAILLEELNDKEHFIAYASGQFSETQKHYHSVFKEILAVKNGIKKFEYHLIEHHFLIRMDSSAFPNIFHFKGKTVPEKMLLRLKDWFSKYDFSVKHIKGSQNLIPDMLSRLSKPENPLTLFSTTYHFPIISMVTSLPPEALTKKTFPFNKNFSSVFAIQEFAKKVLFRFSMRAYNPFPFSTFHLENLFLTGLTLDPSKETTEDVLWYIWCLTVLYATKLILPISPTLEHLLNPDNATSLTWTLLEWFSPIPWWRKKLQQLSEIYNLDRMPAPEAQMFTSIFIIHRPYFQHPDTNLFWTQDQVYEWFTAPHIAVIENDIQDVLHNYLCQLNHQPPPLKDISHTSLGPQHDILMIPTPSAISKPKSTGIIIKEERPDYTDFLYQDS